MSSKKRIFSMLLLVGVVVAVVALLIRFRPEPATDTRETPVTRVETVIVTAKTVNPGRRFSGRLEPARRATLSFEVSGRIAAVHVEPGHWVAANEELLELEPGDYKDRLVEAEAALVEEQQGIERDRKLLDLSIANADYARKEVDRLSKLGASLASESAVDSARQQLAKAESEMAQLQFALDTAEQGVALRQATVNRAARELERTRIRAPWKGRINRRFVEAGDYASKGKEAIELIDDSGLEAVLHVPSQLLRNLNLGDKVLLEIDGLKAEGSLTSIQPDADEQTGTHPLRITLPGEGLVSGLQFAVELKTGELRDVAVVPLSAVLTDDGKTYLFIVSDNRLERRPVITGIRDNGLQVIAEGVAPGEVVVARDVAALVDGQAVDTTGEKE